MKNNDFKYDVAFSFLKQDEPLANTINNLLQDRVSTFIYSKQQDEIAGKDGEETFNRVFGCEARVVAVLYRDGWGQTPWTRIEEIAIRNRAYKKGYNFAVFIQLDHASAVPEWLPKTQIWVAFERWGIQGAATVIEAKIQETGGTPHEETAEEQATRISRQIIANEKRKDFLESSKGVHTAMQEFDELFNKINQLSQNIENPKSRIMFTIERANRQKEFAVLSHGLKLSIEWSLQFSNSLEGSILYVQLLESGRSFGRIKRDAYGEESTIIAEERFLFDANHEEKLLWKRVSGEDQRIFATTQLADHCVQILLKQIHKIRLDE